MSRMYSSFTDFFICTMIHLSPPPPASVCRRMLGSKTERSRLWNWRSDAVTLATLRTLPAISHPHLATYISSTIRPTSHPQFGYISSTTRLHLIHTGYISPQLGYISSTTRPTSHPPLGLHLIHQAAYISSTTRPTYHPQLGYISSTTRPTSPPQLDYILSTARLHFIHDRPHLIHNSTTSYPQLGYIPSSPRLYLFFHCSLHLIQNKIKISNQGIRNNLTSMHTVTALCTGGLYYVL